MKVLQFFIFNRRIQTSLLIGFIVFIIFPAFLVGLFSFSQSKAVIERSVFNTLDYLADAQEKSINNWIMSRKTFIKGLAQNKYMQVMDNQESAKILRDALKMDNNFRSLVLVGKDGRIKVDPELPNQTINTYVGDREYFQQAISGTTFVSEVLVSRNTKRPVMMVATPVKQGDEIVGVLSGIVNISVITEITQHNSPGVLGESYLINDKGLMVSESRFTTSTEPLKLKVQNHPALTSREGEKGKGIYKNYLNRTVFGTYRWLPEMRLSLVVEKDYERGLMEYGLATYLKVLGAACLIIGFFLVFAIIYSRRLTKPLERLAAEVNNIAKGNFLSIIDLKANREVQELSRAINNMSANLLEKTTQLNNLIKQLEQNRDDLHEEKNKLVKISITDELTDLYNRRYLNKELLRVIDLCSTLNKNISLLMLDLDRFKAVNDNYGHATGDTVLKEFAEILRRCSRGTDVVGRFGGEEFVIIIPFVSAERVALIAERIRQEISNFVFDEGNSNLHVTVSIGVVTVKSLVTSTTAEVAEKLIKKADENLYQAKNSGRNKVVHREIKIGELFECCPPEKKTSDS
ncbi:diguanylate cyclase [Desulforamulus reducens MI-1]|uniref:Diguanylate cyclase n=1 Tax=Desulforamulus reducens (strain ATCC BAA-1160 / DSM 100696 / MI-1) TaxID=349161 RepID=A4J287_DESRM|nr:GGDEF domain-containing protein [Desulforamulus reducens]ABO49190.1 diguanylate cyclase [Desulforamulus reducens MI-1]